MEKKKNAKRIILGITVFSFVLFFSQFTFPPKISFAINSDLNWSNPNANGNNPYKLTTDAILNSSTMMQVVGCTGLVDKVSGAITNFIKNPAKIIKAARQLIYEKALTKACKAIKSGVSKGTAIIPDLGPGLTAVALDTDCDVVIKIDSKEANDILSRIEDQNTATAQREGCFNGLAYTLAKNQLTSMTRETVNWVNQGFNGNPLYVQNITSLTNSIERNVIETTIDVLDNKAFPYGGDFSHTLIKSYNGGVMNGAVKYLDSLTSDLSAFLTDTTSYTNYDASDTNLARQRAMQANNAFSNDFSVGGWDGYLALTQRDQNNPLGFTMAASQYIADRIDQQATQTKAEVAQNNGFLSQKTCLLWRVYDETTKKPLTKETGKVLFSGIVAPDGTKSKDVMAITNVGSPTKTTDYDQCIDWKVTTPGSIIKDKLTTYINSPERQLELADTINKSLSGLFTKLIENFRSEGLFGLSQEKYSAIDNAVTSGYGINGTGIDANLGSGYSPSYYGSGSGYNNDSFSLTRDLGNTYIHDDTVSLGNWDAKTNTPKLNINLGPSYSYINIDNQPVYYPSGYYYTVNTVGDTKLFNNGYTGWAEGDRAFWNGTEWQNWKKGQASPIAKRGVVQIQSDYIVAAKEILKVLPSIMPKIGELDYCIPGPNPSFQTNSAEASGLFSDFVETLGSTYDDGGFFERNSTNFKIATPGMPAYDNYEKIFLDEDENNKIYNSYATIGEYSNPWFDEVKKTSKWYALTVTSVMKSANNQKENLIQESINDLMTEIQKDIVAFFPNYNTNVFKGIYGIMQPEYLEVEDTADPIKNTAYVPMLSDGYAITKNMVSTNEDITTATQDYKDAIIQAQSNIGKLNIIKSEVSKIIKDAQDRRDILLLVDIRQKPEYKTLADNKAKEKYLNDYKECFVEENISYFDPNDIMTDSGGTIETRCNDGLDNDLDGLIDTKDLDCIKANITNTCSRGQTGTPPDCVVATCPRGETGTPPTCVAAKCQNGTQQAKTSTDTIPSTNKSCTLYTTESDCNANTYYLGRYKYKCGWN